jgi:rod shape determining protein RodA
MFDRRLIKNFDFGLLILCLILGCLGIISIYSTTHFTMETDLFLRQAIWLGIGAALMILLTFFNYRLLWEWAWPIYIFSIVLLIGVLIFGRQTLGAQRWFKLGLFSFQPSEFAKLAFIILLAKYLAPEGIERKLTRFADLFIPVLLLGIPFMLVIKQPDLGSGLVFVFIFFGMLFFAGAKIKHLAILLAAGLGASPLAWFFLKDYQKARVMIFLDPSRDPLSSGYHIIQSKITIGSGRFLGKGFLNGTQTQLRFLPKQHTDFIFSVIGEEFGFIGALILVSLYFALIYRGIKVVSTRDMFGRLLVAGIISGITFQIFINIGMGIGLAPVTGLPLPLLSYGGSSLIFTLIEIGIILNVRMRHFMF